MEIKRGLVLVNLGSPDSYSIQDVRAYLRQFLMDERVIDAPYLIRKIIVEGFVLPFRPKKSAEAYRSVWMKEGAPLKVLTEQFKQALKPMINIPVSMAMRYANPTPEMALKELEVQNPNLKEVLIAPLYPHFAMSSYETAYLYVLEKMQSIRPDMIFKILQPFYNEGSYLRALKDSITPYLKKSYDHILFSYHGLPVRHLKKSDPGKNHCYQVNHCCDAPSSSWNFCYKHQVIQTTHLVAKELQIPADRFSYSFQSRLGSDQWIKPYTIEQLKKFPLEGVKNLLVVCPAFVSDCLETLEEIAIQGKEIFMKAGGESFELVSCLNSHISWVKTFAAYCNEVDGEYINQWK